MHVHLQTAHPGESKDFERIFRFDVEESYQSAFTRQLGEAVKMKNSGAVILNLKEEYSRCIIPDVGLGERGWKEWGDPRESHPNLVALPDSETMVLQGLIVQ